MQLYSVGKQWLPNLAGRVYADQVIRRELNRASIPIVEMQPDTHGVLLHLQFSPTSPGPSADGTLCLTTLTPSRACAS